MKLIIILVVVFCFSSFYVFSEQRLVSFDFGTAIRYNHVFGNNEFYLTSLRSGILVDMVFNLNKAVGLGIDSGFYFQFADDLTTFLYDIPINAVIDLKTGKIIFKLFGGLYIQSINSNYYSSTEYAFDVGARFIFWFYFLEASYIIADPGGIVVGAGISFRL